jgi:hypothetical protein
MPKNQLLRVTQEYYNSNNKLLSFIYDKNIWNIIILIIFFPTYLYLLQTQYPLLSVFGILGFVILCIYLFILYRNRIRFYQIPLHFIIASILFMRVIKGDTIPLGIIVAVLGISLFLVQDIISNEEYKKSEIMRQIVLSGIVFMSFATYSYLFGSIFITDIHPIILSLFSFIATFNIITYILWIYNTEARYYIILATIGAMIITQIFIGLRILPFTHLTQSVLLTTYLLFSVSIFKDNYFRVLNLKKIISRITLVFLLSLSLIFTSML